MAGERRMLKKEDQPKTSGRNLNPTLPPFFDQSPYLTDRLDTIGFLISTNL